MKESGSEPSPELLGSQVLAQGGSYILPGPLTFSTAAAGTSFHPACYCRTVAILSANTSPFVVAARLCAGKDCEAKFRLIRREASDLLPASALAPFPSTAFLPRCSQSYWDDIKWLQGGARVPANRTWALSELPGRTAQSCHLCCIYPITIYLQAQTFIGTVFVFWTCTLTQELIYVKEYIFWRSRSLTSLFLLFLILLHYDPEMWCVKFLSFSLSISSCFQNMTKGKFVCKAVGSVF